MANNKRCEHCGEEIPNNSVKCPTCLTKISGEKEPKVNKLIVFIIPVLVLVAAITIGIIASMDSSNPTSGSSYDYSNNYDKEDINNYEEEQEKPQEIIMIDFSEMTKENIQSWCNENKVKCQFLTKYSDTIKKDNFISQSASKDETVYEGDTISIYYSLGKEPTKGQRNALKKAESYSELLHMSKKGIYKQLTSEYGEGFTKEEAQYAIDNLNVDYKQNALEKAKSYQDTLNMSKKRIYQQLISSYGEGFTKEEAKYAIDHLDD